MPRERPGEGVNSRTISTRASLGAQVELGRYSLIGLKSPSGAHTAWTCVQGPGRDARTSRRGCPIVMPIRGGRHEVLCLPKTLDTKCGGVGNLGRNMAKVPEFIGPERRAAAAGAVDTTTQAPSDRLNVRLARFLPHEVWPIGPAVRSTGLALRRQLKPRRND